MITLADCLAMCGLSEDEVLAIAEHEHIPEIAAVALGQYLLNQAQGPGKKIRDMIRDDIRSALARNDRAHARELLMALRHFLSEHPQSQVTGALSCERNIAPKAHFGRRRQAAVLSSTSQ